jgi:hypothetical protein
VVESGLARPHRRGVGVRLRFFEPAFGIYARDPAKGTPAAAALKVGHSVSVDYTEEKEMMMAHTINLAPAAPAVKK